MTEIDPTVRKRIEREFVRDNVIKILLVLGLVVVLGVVFGF